MKSRTVLAETAERLRRSLGLTGRVETELADLPLIQPVTTVDDASRPGCNPFRNRAWSCGANVSPVAAIGALAVRATSPVIVDGLVFGTTGAAVHMFWRIAAPGSADPFALGNQAIFVENNVSATDFAPVVWGQTNAMGAAAGVDVGRIGGNGSMAHVPTRIFLPTGGILIVANVAATCTNSYTVYGRTF